MIQRVFLGGGSYGQLKEILLGVFMFCFSYDKAPNV